MGVLAPSQYVKQTYAAELLQVATSGLGYPPKDRVGNIPDFLDALERVAAGGIVIDPEVVRQLLARRRDPISTNSARPASTWHGTGTLGHAAGRGEGSP